MQRTPTGADRIPSVHLTRFSRADFATYASWFADPAIRASLYSTDEAWLEHVLNDTAGAQYAAYLGNQLVAVVGILWPTDDHPHYVMTDIAVNPGSFRRGIGSAVVRQLIDLHRPTGSQKWVAFVEEKNEAARVFFRRNGWRRVKSDPAEEGMIRYEFWPA